MNTKKIKSLSKLLEQDVGPLTFGDFVCSSRMALNITQVDLAKKLKISKSTLCDIEKGRQLVSPALAVKIAKVTKFSEKLALETCLQDQLRKANINMQVTVAA